MGWMTLHSISLLYPEQPTHHDQQMLKAFLHAFAESITCPHCERHFKAMFENYIRKHPEWNTSRFNLFLFVARAHNTVNKRLEKPQKKTVQECLEAIGSASQYTPLSEFRKNYINYVIHRMAAEMAGDSLVKAGYGRDMRRINETYWNSKITTDTSNFDTNADVLEPISDNATSMPFMIGQSRFRIPIDESMPRFSMQGGRFRLTRR
jgi:hypothetical protein